MTAHMSPTGSSPADWAAVAGAVFALLAVAAGAFGAHGLESRISAASLDTFETGVRYQMYHALALLLVAALSSRATGGPWHLAAGSFVAGIVLFSGSLYALSLGAARWIGAVTPVGGVLFLVGWVLVLVSAWSG